jgi:hypothetical protein
MNNLEKLEHRALSNAALLAEFEVHGKSMSA